MEIAKLVPFWLCVGFAISLEIPKYKVLKEYKTFEERFYERTTWISTTDEDPLNIKGMYLRLYYYMQGANSEGKTIEMTAPMLRHCHGDGNITMLLYLPMSLQKNPPSPTDKAVNITELPSNNYLVRKFGGFANEEIWLEELETLKENAKIDRSNETEIVDDNDDYYAASYSGFHDIVDRRNEIWLPERKQIEARLTK